MQEDYFSHLRPEEKYILKDKGTEPPFTGEYNELFEPGIFICRACKSPLYESKTKFNSGCGWPAFDDEINGSIVRYEDLSSSSVRTEICCSKCDGHLGHVFNGEQSTDKDTRHCVNSLSLQFRPYKNLEQATFGAGCFWQVDKLFKDIKGIYLSAVGYMGGETEDPTYEDVISGDTNYAEVVNIYFSPKLISYSDILDIFWENHNPTTLNMQGFDVGSQYRSVIFHHSNKQKEIIERSISKQAAKWKDPIVTEISLASTFYRAEEYHQNYLKKNNSGICGV